MPTVKHEVASHAFRRHALTELLAKIESIIADKEARLLTVIGDEARTHLIDDIAELQLRHKEVLAAIVGDANPLRG